MFCSIAKSWLVAAICLAVSANVALAGGATPSSLDRQGNFKRFSTNEHTTANTMIRKRQKAQPLPRAIQVNDKGSRQPLTERAIAEAKRDGITALPLTFVERAHGGRRSGQTKRAKKEDDQPTDGGGGATGQPLELGQGITVPATFNGQDYCVHIASNWAHGNVLPVKGSQQPYDIANDPDATLTGATTGDGPEYTIASTVLGGVEAKDVAIALLPDNDENESIGDACAAILGIGLPGQGRQEVEASFTKPGFIETSPTLFAVTDGTLWVGGQPQGLGSEVAWTPSLSPTAWSISGSFGDEPFEAEYVWDAAATYVPTESAQRIFDALGLTASRSQDGEGTILAATVDCEHAVPFTVTFGDQVINYTDEQTIWVQPDKTCVFFIVGSDEPGFAYPSTIGYNLINGFATLFDATDLANPRIGLAAMA